MPSINFFSEDIPFNLKKKNAIKKWIRNTIVAEDQKLNELTFIFCSDEYLLNINRSYLNHDTYTDIITFDNSDKPGFLTGDIFISIDRICDNAKKFKVSEVDELHRVMIHGVLHLLGYSDKTQPAKAKMTAKEDEYLKEREFTTLP
ncbi:MAG TPA: rRNA maturation RNase YbeY [Sphingobacteriaceae bacterium]